MRILFLSQLVPFPPDSGPKVRQYLVIRYLAQAHDITLVAFARPDDSPSAMAHLGQYCRRVRTVPMRRSKIRNILALAGSWLSGESFIIRRDYVPEMAQVIQEEIASGGYDVIHADQLWMAQYALLGANRGAKLILDEHNACFQIFQRLAKGEANPLKKLALERDWRKLRSYETQACRRFDQVVTVTEEDRKILEGLIFPSESVRAGEANSIYTDVRRPKLSTIPICVDTASVKVVAPQGASHDVLHLGTMFWPPNVEGVMWFAEHVWPGVRSQLPDATFTIVGKNPPAKVTSLAEKGLGIQVTGYVQDPQEYLEQAGAYVVPVFSAGGMRVKIVDGWRWGLPVISTTIGAEGIRYVDGENILIADDAEAFAAAVVGTLEDRELNQRLRLNGRRWVEEKYDWQRVYPAWDNVYAEDG